MLGTLESTDILACRPVLTRGSCILAKSHNVDVHVGTRMRQRRTLLGIMQSKVGDAALIASVRLIICLLNASKLCQFVAVVGSFYPLPARPWRGMTGDTVADMPCGALVDGAGVASL